MARVAFVATYSDAATKSPTSLVVNPILPAAWLPVEGIR